MMVVAHHAIDHDDAEGDREEPSQNFFEEVGGGGGHCFLCCSLKIFGAQLCQLIL